MKKLFGFRHKKENVPVQTMRARGITETEYFALERALNCEYAHAAERQRSCTNRPSSYMKGLLFAIAALHDIVPHDMEVQK